jgi:hypothetical protein
LSIDKLKHKFYVALYQFNFQQDVGCSDALTAVTNVLLNAYNRSETLVLTGLDDHWVFNLLVQPYMLLFAEKQGVNTSIISALQQIYSRLKIHLKLPPIKFSSSVPCDKLVDFCKGARQGAVFLKIFQFLLDP